MSCQMVTEAFIYLVCLRILFAEGSYERQAFYF